MSLHTLFLRGAFVACVASLATGAVLAQGTPSSPDVRPDVRESQAEAPSRNQKIENIHVEDAGARVDEVRYGGRTQSVNVSPKANVPSYQVLPDDGGRSRQGQQETGSGGMGARVWNLFNF